jgi:hypothetical protein
MPLSPIPATCWTRLHCRARGARRQSAIGTAIGTARHRSAPLDIGSKRSGNGRQAVLRLAPRADRAGGLGYGSAASRHRTMKPLRPFDAVAPAGRCTPAR